MPSFRPRQVPPTAIELIRRARQEFGYGAARTRLWLQRVHRIRLAMGTIQRVFRDIGIPRLRRTRKRESRQMRLFEKAETGRVDAGRREVRADRGSLGLSVHRSGRLHALPCAAAVPALHHGSSLAFLTEFRRAFSFPIKRVQSDHGQEFSLAFVLGSRPPGSATDTFGPGARSRTARSSAAIGSTTRSSGGGTAFRTSRRPLKLSEAGRADTTTERFSLALHGRTPAEKLAAFQPPRRAA